MTDRPDPLTEIERLFDEFVQLGSPMQQQLPVDVVDADEEIIVTAELPGREPSEIDVHLEEGRRLHIGAGAVRAEHDGRHVTRERSSGALDRSVDLPAAVDEEGTEAGYDRGVLTVRLPKLTGSEDGTDIPVN